MVTARNPLLPSRNRAVPTLAADRLVTFARDLFVAGGIVADEAQVVAHSLVDANLAGHDSHGIIRIPQYLKALDEGVMRSGVALEVVHETPAVLVCDGQWGPGQVQAHRLLQRLVQRARVLGLAAGTVKHCGHIGRLGEYAEAATGLGFAFIGTVNNHGYGRSVAPPGGTVGRIGTNPLCLAVPGKPGEPVVLDIGTSVCAEGKVRVQFNKGLPTPEGWLLDPEGRPTTDAGVLYREPRGTILPLGGPQAYKGFGIGLLLDMLVGGLSGGPCSRPEAPPRSANGVLFVLLDSKHFAGAEHFTREITNLVDNVRTCPRAAGVQAIQLPGDPERQERARRLQTGLHVDDGTWGQLVALAGRLRVPLPG
jgi:hydroxycarboxylate dehydrogenase B